MTSAILAPLIQSVIAAIGLVFTALVGVYVPRGIAAFERRTGVVVTEQERAAVMSAVTTAAGLLQTRLDQGSLRITDIHPGNVAVLQEAAAALDRVPTSAANQGTTMQAAAAMIVARVDTSPKPPIGVAMGPPRVASGPSSG